MDETWIHHYTPGTKRAVQSDQKLNSGLSRLWHPYFGTRMVFCLSTILRKVKPLTATITWHYQIDWAQTSRKTTSHAKEKSAVPPRQSTVPQVHENDGQIEWIKLRIASPPTIFSKFGSQRLLNLCWPEKNTPGEGIWFQWRSDCRNWGLFWDQKRTILQKRHRKVREALVWMYYTWRKLQYSRKVLEQDKKSCFCQFIVSFIEILFTYLR